MSTIVLAVSEDLLVLRGDGDQWEVLGRHPGVRPRSLATDPVRPDRIWCGTDDGALLTTSDGGGTWRVLPGPGPAVPISALAVGYGAPGPVYAGFDPSALYRSDDDGEAWLELESMLGVPSAPTWSFPPRPDTSHVRCILVDPHAPDTVYVCIEAGALLRSHDRGRTWIDRSEDGPQDTHTLRAHRLAPRRLYSAAGDGFMKPGHGVQRSLDGGESWERLSEGLRHHYGWDIAVDPADPDTMVVSIAASPWEAHTLGAGKATMYRSSAGGAWEELHDGLPAPDGSVAATLATGPALTAEFYAGSNRGLYRSEDAGVTWRRLDLGDAEWADTDRVNALVVTA